MKTEEKFWYQEKFGLILSWQKYKYVFITDIKQIFRQIGVQSILINININIINNIKQFYGVLVSHNDLKFIY